MILKDEIKALSSEIALTYKCQNRCEFCPAPDLSVRKNYYEMSTGDAELVIHKLHDAGIQTITFTGGEPTLRNDLFGLVLSASEHGIAVNLHTNGIKLADRIYARELLSCGLKSAQVGLHSDDQMTHNIISGNMESFSKTVEGIHNLADTGIETSLRCTITGRNRDRLCQLVDYVKSEFNICSIIIDMGLHFPQWKKMESTYTSLLPLIDGLLKRCNSSGVRLIWGSPLPHCIFDVSEHNLDTASCGAVPASIYVSPSGDVTSCPGSDHLLGNLVNQSFESIWTSRMSAYKKRGRRLPPVCSKCAVKQTCAGGCPLYWERTGSFMEIEKAVGKKSALGNFVRAIDRSLRTRSETSRKIKGGSLLSPFQ